MRNADGRIAVAENRIVVHAKPEARISVSPQTVFMKKECVLDAGQSSVSKPPASFEVRWDLDNNGTWDYPETGGYTTAKTVKKTWNEAGLYTVVLEIKDCFGSLAWASAEVKAHPASAPTPVPASKPVIEPARLNNKPAAVKDIVTVKVLNAPPSAHAGEDVLSKKGRKVALKGTGEDPDGRIVLYEWDFDGNGSFDWSSPKSGEVKRVFNEYSSAVFRVTDNNGVMAKDTLRVVICPEGMTGVEPGPFCIDNYEWPNSRGKEPLRDISLAMAREKCLAAGKRLCTGGEWEAACAGKRNVRYPQSNSPPEQNCNVVGNRFFSNRVAPSGSFPECKSPAGVFDMNGNVDEWTDDGGGDSAFVYGGSWHHDLANAQCSSKLPLLKYKGYFYVGFRCCK
jgi:hypothetical protein